MTRRTVTRREALRATAGAAALVATGASAQSLADFYRGRKVTLITAASPGGGYDQYARLLARHMPRYIPGEPQITVQNMPGAEGLLASNHLYNIAAQDGSVIGGVSRNNGLARFYDFGNAGSRFDARKLHGLGSPPQEIGHFVVNTQSGVTSVEEIRGRELTVSSTARSSPSSVYARMLNAMFGSNLRVVEGYGGSQECLMAVERHETDSHISGGSSAQFRNRMMPWVKDGTARVILQMGMARDAAFADVPTALEIMKTPADKQLFEIAFAEQVMGRPFLLGPGVPADRVKMLREAFDSTMKDKQFLAEAAKEGAEIDPVDGATINALLDRVYAAPPDVAERLRALAR